MWKFDLSIIKSKLYDSGMNQGELAKDFTERTVITKFGLDDGEVEFLGTGDVKGHILNQFSMDEYDEHFRIATTSGNFWQGDSANNVYVLDPDLEVVGELEDLAPGEKIYSVRFMGEKGYVVTFKKIDPLFVIDLSDHENPSVLGKLKIPGYSDYLHPYDENHIIGIGKETVEAEEELVEMYAHYKYDVANDAEMEVRTFRTYWNQLYDMGFVVHDTDWAIENGYRQR